MSQQDDPPGHNAPKEPTVREKPVPHLPTLTDEPTGAEHDLEHLTLVHSANDGTTGDDGPVGYKNPPKSGQFKPGMSGNPRGRPKAVSSYRDALIAELLESMGIREGGKERRVTKMQASIKSLVARAIKGDSRAMSTLLREMDKITKQEPPESEETVAKPDREIIDEYFRNVQAMKGSEP